MQAHPLPPRRDHSLIELKALDASPTRDGLSAHVECLLDYMCLHMQNVLLLKVPLFSVPRAAVAEGCCKDIQALTWVIQMCSLSFAHDVGCERVERIAHFAMQCLQGVEGHDVGRHLKKEVERDRKMSDLKRRNIVAVYGLAAALLGLEVKVSDLKVFMGSEDSKNAANALAGLAERCGTDPEIFAGVRELYRKYRLLDDVADYIPMKTHKFKWQDIEPYVCCICY